MRHQAGVGYPTPSRFHPKLRMMPEGRSQGQSLHSRNIFNMTSKLT